MVWPLSLLSGGSDAEPSQETDKNDLDQQPSSPVKELLRHFESPSLSLPPSSRVGDPRLKQRESQPIRVWHLWKYGAFAAMKATELTAALLSYHLRGPPKKSWGLGMTLLTCIMRDISRHSQLADIAMIRMLMGISGLVPVPSDALVTPVTFRVLKRSLRGILADFDAIEDGTRELSGEWVVGKRTWQRLQREWQHSRRLRLKLGQETTTDPASQPKRKERVILYLHGGAYYLSSPQTHRLITIPLSKHLDARLFALDYRLAPETRFPGPLHDAVSAYFRLVDDLHISPENIIISGDSAGGGLSLALMMYLRDNDYPLPGGAILMSPWVDLTMSCDSWDSNAKYDVVPMPEPGDHLNPIACYLGEHMEKYLTHPYASPLFGDLKGLPPLLIQGGDSEVLRDEITLLAHKATLAGVNVRHELYEDAVHVFQSFPFLDQARQAFMSAREFVRDLLVQRAEHESLGLQPTAEQYLENEIDVEHARVVQGDGTDCFTKKADIMEKSKKLSVDTEVITVKEVSEKDSDGEEGSSSQDEDPSWVTHPWPSPPATPEMDAGLQNERRKSVVLRDTPRNLPGRRRATSSSTWNTFVSISATSSHAQASTGGASLRRVQSCAHLVRKTEVGQTAAAPPSREYRLPAASLSSCTTTPAPRPLIRRSQASHPDMASLCAEWAHRGPANQTLKFKPDPAAPRRRSVIHISGSSPTDKR